MTRMDSVGRALRVLREERELTQRQVAEALGLRASVISSWECGKTAPSLARFGQLADLFALDLGDLDDVLAIVEGQPHRRRRSPARESDADQPQLVKFLLGAPGLFPATPAEQTLSTLLSNLHTLLRQVQEGKGPEERPPPAASGPPSRVQASPGAPASKRGSRT